MCVCRILMMITGTYLLIYLLTVHQTFETLAHITLMCVCDCLL